MKILIYIIFILISCIVYSQDNHSYILKWKISIDKPVAYKTSWENIDNNSAATISEMFGNTLKFLTDSSKSAADSIKNIFSMFDSLYSNVNLTTILTRNDKDIIDIKIVGTKKNNNSGTPDSVKNIFSALMEGVQLRGKINSYGGIESFYMKKEQLNLLSLMFELPGKPVKIGDKWTILANIISYDQHFICNEYLKNDSVELSDVKIIEGDTIAYIKYDLRYYVNGDFMTPFSENSTPTSLDCTYTGIAEFNITKGKWSNYNLLTTINGIGFPTTQTKQIQRLVELKKIPKEVLEYK